MVNAYNIPPIATNIQFLKLESPFKTNSQSFPRINGNGKNHLYTQIDVYILSGTDQITLTQMYAIAEGGKKRYPRAFTCACIKKNGGKKG